MLTLYNTVLETSNHPDGGQIIQWYLVRCMPVFPPSETQKITEMSYWYELRQISVITSFKKIQSNYNISANVTLGPLRSTGEFCMTSHET